MPNLLDTHALIWYLTGDASLTIRAKQLIEAVDAENFVSIASLWEIAIKVQLGKLELNGPYEMIGQQLEKNGFFILPIALEDTQLVSKLPLHHRDPFDRILIAQAINQKLTILTKDQFFCEYDAVVAW